MTGKTAKFKIAQMRCDITESTAFRSARDRNAVIAIAFYMGRNPRASYGDVSELCGVSKSQTYEIVCSLRSEGYLPKIVGCPTKDEMNAWLTAHKGQLKIHGDDLKKFYAEMQGMTFIGSWERYCEAHLLEKHVRRKK